MRNEYVKLVEQLLKDNEDTYEIKNIDESGELLDEIYKDTIAFFEDVTKRDYLRTYFFVVKDDIKEEFIKKIEGIAESLEGYSLKKAKLDIDGTVKTVNVKDQIEHKQEGSKYILKIDIEKEKNNY